jgi:hypothetical protein
MDALYAAYGTAALLVAHEIGMFGAVDDRAKSIQELATALAIPARSADALLTVAAAQGFVTARDGRYTLTPLGRDYLLDSGPFSRKGMLDFARATAVLVSPENLKKAVLSGHPFGYGEGEMFGAHEQQAERARVFTRAMHSQSAAAACTWPRQLDLSRNQGLLDVGGGSGAHAIGAVQRWPNLRAIVFDMASVCELATEYAKEAGCSDRVAAQAGDMWKDRFPEADVHFYSLVFHDWPEEKCRFLAKKSFDSLPRGGRIIIHEPLVNDDRIGPLAPALFSAIMLLWTEGRQYSGRELNEIVSGAGFAHVEVIKTFGYWGIVTGLKA